MSTKTKKSPDNTHKLNKRAICLRAPLALIILLTVFLAPQRSASTQQLPKDPAAEETEMIGNVEVLKGQAIIRFVDAEPDQLETLMGNAISLVNASGHRKIGPGNLNMLHIRSNMNTRALLNILSRVSGALYVEPVFVVKHTLTPNDTRFGEM